MTDREKLVELLDIIIQPGQKTLGEIADHLLAHGVTVKEPQKPMTVDEIDRRLRDVVYAEDKGKHEIIPVFVMRNCISNPNYFIFSRCDGTVFPAYHEEMNWRWRCWAEKPTEEERKGAEWEN